MQLLLQKKGFLSKLLDNLKERIISSIYSAVNSSVRVSQQCFQLFYKMHLNLHYFILWCLVSPFNGMSTFMGYLILKPSLSKNSISIIQLIVGDKSVLTFLKNICPKVQIIARLLIELAYRDVAVKHVSHHTTGTTQFH